jgi:hypothetical protein
VGVVGAAHSREFFRWRAQFAFKHYGEKGYKSGFFRQFDGTYNRGCCDVDYIDDPLWIAYAVRHFVKWCNATYTFPTVRVSIDDKIVIEGEDLAEALRPTRAPKGNRQ